MTGVGYRQMKKLQKRYEREEDLWLLHQGRKGKEIGGIWILTSS